MVRDQDKGRDWVRDPAGLLPRHDGRLRPQLPHHPQEDDQEQQAKQAYRKGGYHCFGSALVLIFTLDPDPAPDFFMTNI